MNSLYHISKELEELNNSLIEAGGEITEETQNKLAILETDLQVKGANYGLVILGNNHVIDAIDAEIVRLTDKKKFLSNANDRLKSTVQQAMEHFGIEKIETPIIKLSFRASESVEVTDEKLLPADYIKTETKVVTSVDKLKIKAAIKAGETVTGAVLNKKQNLQIK